MSRRVYHIILLLAVVTAMISCAGSGGRLPDLTETYSYRDARPFGGSVAYAVFSNAYPDRKPEFIKKQFAANDLWSYDTASLYFNVSRNFYLSDADAESLLSFAYRGNTAFISAEKFDSVLLDKLSCKQERGGFGFLLSGNLLENSSVKLIPKLEQNKEGYNYFFFPLDHYFSSVNDSYSREVGVNDDGKTNCFVFFWGKGRIYLHCEPKAFSNYFLLTKNNTAYLQEVMQLLPAQPENIYWDNFHSAHNYSENTSNDDFSTFGTIMKYPSLSHAFFIALALLLLYIFFNSKRKQRIMPVMKPVENTTVAFAEAIAGMYLSKKDNRLIAEKIITYFNEHVRSKYFITLTAQQTGYAELLHRKSGVPEEITGPLTETILDISASAKVSDQQLLLLNGRTEKFFKYKK